MGNIFFARKFFGNSRYIMIFKQKFTCFSGCYYRVVPNFLRKVGVVILDRTKLAQIGPCEVKPPEVIIKYTVRKRI